MNDALPAPVATWRILLGLGAIALGIFLSILIGGAIIAAGGWDLDVSAADGADFGRTVGQRGLDQVLDHNRIPLEAAVLLNIPLWAGFIGVPLWAARARGLDWRRDLGWGFRPIDVPAGLAIGVLAQLVLVPLLYLPLQRWIDSGELEEPARNLVASADSSLGIVALVVLTVFGAPIAEEVVFRGLIFRGILDMEGARRFAMPTAVVASSAIFAAFHFQVLQFPGLMLIGAVAALVMYRTGRLGTAICVHMGFNLTTVIILLPEVV